LHGGDQLSLAYADALELGRQALPQPGDLGAPIGEARLDRALGFGERRGEVRARVALTLGHVAAALLDDPPLLLLQRGDRLGTGEGERLRELLGTELGLLGDDRVEAGLAALDLVVERLPRGPGALERHERGDRGTAGDGGGEDRDDEGGGHDPLG